MSSPIRSSEREVAVDEVVGQRPQEVVGAVLQDRLDADRGVAPSRGSQRPSWTVSRKPVAEDDVDLGRARLVAVARGGTGRCGRARRRTSRSWRAGCPRGRPRRSADGARGRRRRSGPRRVGVARSIHRRRSGSFRSPAMSSTLDVFVVLSPWQLRIRTSPGSVAPIPPSVSLGAAVPSAGWPSDPCGEPSRVGRGALGARARGRAALRGGSERDRRFELVSVSAIWPGSASGCGGGGLGVCRRPPGRESTRPPPEGEAGRDRDERSRRRPRGTSPTMIDAASRDAHPSSASTTRPSRSGRSRSSAG